MGDDEFVSAGCDETVEDESMMFGEAERSLYLFGKEFGDRTSLAAAS